MIPGDLVHFRPRSRQRETLPVVKASCLDDGVVQIGDQVSVFRLLPDDRLTIARQVDPAHVLARHASDRLVLVAIADLAPAE